MSQKKKVSRKPVRKTKSTQVPKPVGRKSTHPWSSQPVNTPHPDPYHVIYVDNAMAFKIKECRTWPVVARFIADNNLRRGECAVYQGRVVQGTPAYMGGPSEGFGPEDDMIDSAIPLETVERLVNV